MVATIAAARFADDVAESWPREGATGGASAAEDVVELSRTATSCVAGSLWEFEEVLAECVGAGLGFFGSVFGDSTTAVDAACVTAAAAGVVVTAGIGADCGRGAALRERSIANVAIAINRIVVRAMARYL